MHQNNYSYCINDHICVKICDTGFLTLQAVLIEGRKFQDTIQTRTGRSKYTCSSDLEMGSSIISAAPTVPFNFQLVLLPLYEKNGIFPVF